MEIRFSHETRVPRHEAFPWLTDFTESDHAGARWGRGAARRIVSRTERIVELEDQWRGRTLRMTVSLDPPFAWHARGRTSGARWKTTFALEDLPNGGCRVKMRSSFGGEGFGKLLLPLIRPLLLKWFREDLSNHVADMEEQLGYASSPK